MSLAISLLINLLLVSSYRDSVQVSDNYSYSPAVVPTGIVNKIDWGATWEFLKDTTLTKVLCQYRKTQICNFTLPFSAPSKVVTNFYNLQVTEKQLSIRANTVASLASLDSGHLLLAQRNGSFFDFDPLSGLARLAFNLGEIKVNGSGFIGGPLAGVNEALGLGIRDFYLDKTLNSTLLFYTYTAVDSNGCLSMFFEKVDLHRSKKSLGNPNNRELIWSSKDECVTFDEAHILGAGGKIEKFSSNEFLITLGDLNLIDNRITKSMWGNILKINSESAKVEIFTRGHRNPSGVIRLLDGRFFGVEQGAQGGDEINQLNLGSDYGWPRSTFGKNYSFGGYIAGENNHKFGIEPLMAFVPSPAFSSIATFTGVAPQYWTNSAGIPDLFITSLKANSIYRCRLSTTRNAINYCEKIFLRERLRDIVALKVKNTFKLYVLTERSSIISITVEDVVRI
jgi:hypothetical protein